MSLSPQTIRIQARLAQWSQSGRKQWDLYRWLWNPFILRDATELVIRNAGVAGLDGEQVEWLKGKEWWMAKELSEELKAGSYQPGAVRRVYIPKRDGRKRPLGIPNVRDRIIQRAMVLLLEPIYEQVFLPCSYGFRPKRRSVDCVAQLADWVYPRRHVLEADIEGFFDNVSHRKLMGMLKKQIVDPRMLRLIRGIMRAGFCEWRKPWQATRRGTPQGGPLSPMLANVYLHYSLDEKLWPMVEQTRGRIRLVRFADDFVVIGKGASDVHFIRKLLGGWMREVGLTLKASKTRVVDLRNHMRGHASKFDFLGYKFHLRAYKDNPKRFWIARQPSEKARKALRENLRTTLRSDLALDEARREAVLVWRGWSNYFRFGNSNRVLRREEQTVRRLFVRYLRRKYRRQKSPVPWRVLGRLIDPLRADVRAPRCVPDLLRQRPSQLALA
jgi:group II intron reverse transcriptase/maturase